MALLVLLPPRAGPVCSTVSAGAAEAEAQKITTGFRFAVIGQVLGQVAAGLGDKCAEVQTHVLAHQVFLLVTRIRRRRTVVVVRMLRQAALGFAPAGFHVAPEPLVKHRLIEVASVVLEPREPRQVIHTCAPPTHLPKRHASVLGQSPARILHGMTQPHARDVRNHAPRGEAHDRHRVRVVEHQRPRAQLPCITQDIQIHRHRPKRLKQPPRPDRVADALVDIVLRRDVVVVGGAVDPLDLDAAEQVIAAGQDFTAIRACGDGPAILLTIGFERLLHDARHRSEPTRIDVDQRDLAALGAGDLEDVTHELMGEHRAGADHGHLDRAREPARQAHVAFGGWCMRFVIVWNCGHVHENCRSSTRRHTPDNGAAPTLTSRPNCRSRRTARRYRCASRGTWTGCC